MMIQHTLRNSRLLRIASIVNSSSSSARTRHVFHSTPFTQQHHRFYSTTIAGTTIDPIDVFTGDYQRNRELTCEELRTQLQRQMKKLDYANTIDSRSMNFVAKRNIRSAIHTTYPTKAKKATLSKRDELCAQILDVYQYAIEDQNVKDIDIEIYVLFMNLFHNLVRNDLVWKVYERMLENNIKPNESVYLILMQACREFGDVEKAKEIHNDIMNNNNEKELLTKSAYWNLFLSTLVKTSVDIDTTHYIHQMLSYNVPITHKLLRIILMSCKDMEAKVQMLKLVNSKFPAVTDSVFRVIIASCIENNDIDTIVTLLEDFSTNKYMNLLLSNGEMLDCVMQLLYKKMEQVESESKQQEILTSMMRIYQIYRTHDLLPKSSALTSLMAGFGLRQKIPYMWMIYRKMKRAKIPAYRYTFECIMNASINAKNVGSCLRVISELAKSKKRMQSAFYTPLFRLLAENSDKRLFVLYATFVEQQQVKPGNPEHILILKQLFDEFKQVEDAAELTKISDLIEKSTGERFL
jgi:uncharacterized protein YneF (UPF0154 family)